MKNILFVLSFLLINTALSNTSALQDWNFEYEFKDNRIYVFNKSGDYVETITRGDLLDKSEYIPMMRLCIKRNNMNREFGNKYINKSIEDIKKGIEYGLVSKKEMNDNNRTGQLIADIKMRNFDASAREFCSILDLAASAYKIKNTDDPY